MESDELEEVLERVRSDEDGYERVQSDDDGDARTKRECRPMPETMVRENRA
jgi:hypothetical protein